MPMSAIRDEVAMMLAEADKKIAKAEAQLAAGGPRRKVEAAGQLAFLKRQRQTLADRLAAVEAEPDAPETLFQWIKEEVFNLTLRLETWIGEG